MSIKINLSNFLYFEFLLDNRMKTQGSKTQGRNGDQYRVEERKRESFVNVRSDEKGSVLRNDNNASREPSGRAARL